MWGPGFNSKNNNNERISEKHFSFQYDDGLHFNYWIKNNIIITFVVIVLKLWVLQQTQYIFSVYVFIQDTFSLVIGQHKMRQRIQTN